MHSSTIRDHERTVKTDFGPQVSPAAVFVSSRSMLFSQLTIYCILIAVASLFGGSLASLVRLTHRRIQLTLSFVSGVMLGVALLALLPHSINLLGSSEPALITCLIGLLFMFFMIRMFHFHQHDNSAITNKTIITCIAITMMAKWISLGPVFALDWRFTQSSTESLLLLPSQLIVNLIFCLMCPLGALLFALTVEQYAGWRDSVLGFSLAFSAGIFLCISLGDLLPEVHFHSHDRVQLSIMLLLGVLVAFLIELGHDHDPNSNSLPTTTTAAEVQTQ